MPQAPREIRNAIGHSIAPGTDGEGQTEIFGLRDVQVVRRTDSFYKKYLGGAPKTWFAPCFSKDFNKKRVDMCFSRTESGIEPLSVQF
jgi:hypothetical protein